MLLAAAASPLAWATWAHRFLPETLASSWFHLPVMTQGIAPAGTTKIELACGSAGDTTSASGSSLIAIPVG